MSSFVQGLSGAMQATFGARNRVPTTRALTAGSIREQPHALYSLMRSLHANTSSYKDLLSILPDYGLDNTALQGLRNPSHAVAGFYEANLTPGTIRENDEQSALPLELTERDTSDALRAAVHRAWRWSNWNDQKDGAAYDAAMLGDQVLKIRSDRVTRRAWFELVPPDYMSDLDVDGRGYLTYIRLDVPQVERRPDGKTETVIHTEVWDKANMRYRRWRHTQNAGSGTDQLGTPEEDADMEQVFGVDFVPFVHWQFDRDSASLRGVPAIMRALDKIIYGDALVTSLHRRLSRENDWLLVGVGTDADGIPMPAPDIRTNPAGNVEIGGGVFHSLPAGWDIKSLVAGLDYQAHLAVVQDHYLALRETDLPELAWGAISETGGESGRALDYKLTPAKSKLEKARGRAESSLIRATQMCLSVAQQIGAPGFSEREIGTYAAGDFDFWIADRPIVPLSEVELSEIETQRVARVQAMTNAGAGLDAAMRLAGYSDEDIERATTFDSGIER